MYNSLIFSEFVFLQIHVFINTCIYKFIILLILASFTLACSNTPTPPYAAILYPDDNPSTEQGVELGSRLFSDPILSADSTISCQSCHLPELAFTDGKTLSVGINGRIGRRNSPSLTNIGYLFRTMFWDGRADNLEAQALHPVADPNEMGGDWPTIITRLRHHDYYGEALKDAFGLSSLREINPDHVGKALAQFQRSLISFNSKYDLVLRGEAVFTDSEARGFNIFMDEADFSEDPEIKALPVSECAHCHIPPHFTNQQFFNNGLDEAPNLTEFPDLGRGTVTGNLYHNGLFRTPGLRNVELTAPYMHDGRFETLEEVVDHYNKGGHYAENRSANVRPLGLSDRDKTDLVTFLRTLTDTVFVNQYTSAK
ncbi:hypothetical protein CEQ90_06090 [Lewinellaceae bacterium SD302]|nr:hypothetical protein CEQ90_06090 [Lewinellaceae bacterium SD302]